MKCRGVDARNVKSLALSKIFGPTLASTGILSPELTKELFRTVGEQFGSFLAFATVNYLVAC